MITIRNGGEEMQIHTYILKLSKPLTTKESENWIMLQKGKTIRSRILKVF